MNLSASGHSYRELVEFYLDGLGKAGYGMSKPVEQPNGNGFDVSFSACSRADTVSILPQDGDPKTFEVRIVYEPRQSGKTAQTLKGKIEGLAAECSFGDTDSCNKIEEMKANSGGLEAQGAHEAMIKEQLKSPEQRSQDRERTHGFSDVPSQ